MDDTPEDAPEPRHLRFLRLLVTVLTGTMIVGFVVLIGFLVTRFPGGAPTVPSEIVLPGDARAVAFTQGTDWFAVVTDDDRILIYDRSGGDPVQTIQVKPAR